MPDRNLVWGSYRGRTGWYYPGDIPLPTVTKQSEQRYKLLAVLGGTEGKINNWNGYDACVVSGTPVGLCESPFGFLTALLIAMTEAHSSVPELQDFWSFFAGKEAFLNSQTGQWEQFLGGDWKPVTTPEARAWLWHRLPTWRDRGTRAIADSYWEQFPEAKRHSWDCAQAYLRLWESPVLCGFQREFCADFIQRLAPKPFPAYVDSPAFEAVFLSFWYNNNVETRRVFNLVASESGLSGEPLWRETLNRIEGGLGFDVWPERARKIRKLVEELYP